MAVGRESEAHPAFGNLRLICFFNIPNKPKNKTGDINYKSSPQTKWIIDSNIKYYNN
jgi:hypothetical protein